MLKDIYQSRINVSHLLIINSVAFVMTFLLWYVAILIEIQLILNPRQPVNQTYWISLVCVFSPVIILYPFIYYKMKWNYKNNNPAKAKSYLIAFGGVILSIVFIWFLV